MRQGIKILLLYEFTVLPTGDNSFVIRTSPLGGRAYPWWRIDKPTNVKILKDGGWHFSFLYDEEGIIKKISSFQHTEFDKDEFKNKRIIREKIFKGEDIFNRNFNFKKINIDSKFPKYLVDNVDKYKDWIKD